VWVVGIKNELDRKGGGGDGRSISSHTQECVCNNVLFTLITAKQ
jgi:hypothetical protein